MIATCGGAGTSYTRMYYVCLRIGQRYSHCERTFTRAAGVSPPWSADRDAEGSASSSGNRTPSRAASVSPPWFGKCASADTSAIRRQAADGVCADRRCGRGHRRHGANVATEPYMAHTAPDYNRVHWRHGGPTPPLLCFGANVCRRNNDFCDAQTHIRPRAAGVSPQWFSEPHLQVQCDEFLRLELACGVHATGGLRPPLLCCNAHV
jgi:hypothetical protein